MWPVSTLGLQDKARFSPVTQIIVSSVQLQSGSHWTCVFIVDIVQSVLKVISNLMTTLFVGCCFFMEYTFTGFKEPRKV